MTTASVCSPASRSPPGRPRAHGLAVAWCNAGTTTAGAYASRGRVVDPSISLAGPHAATSRYTSAPTRTPRRGPNLSGVADEVRVSVAPTPARSGVEPGMRTSNAVAGRCGRVGTYRATTRPLHNPGIGMRPCARVTFSCLSQTRLGVAAVIVRPAAPAVPRGRYWRRAAPPVRCTAAADAVTRRCGAAPTRGTRYDGGAEPDLSSLRRGPPLSPRRSPPSGGALCGTELAPRAATAEELRGGQPQVKASPPIPAVPRETLRLRTLRARRQMRTITH